MTDDSHSDDPSGLEAAEDEIDEEPEPGLGPGADDGDEAEIDDDGE
ncbi:hypothetical protein [Halopiger goleimassiliensis]|nr:hypothetical protein [Halopiger goleimassiliensis]